MTHTPLRSTIVDRIAIAIAETHPEDPHRELMAEVLAAAAESDGIPIHAVLAWLYDRPAPHEISTRAWRAFCRRYKIVPTRTA
jgi:hypothetical protein